MEKYLWAFGAARGRGEHGREARAAPLGPAWFAVPLGPPALQLTPTVCPCLSPGQCTTWEWGGGFPTLLVPGGGCCSPRGSPLPPQMTTSAPWLGYWDETSSPRAGVSPPFHQLWSGPIHRHGGCGGRADAGSPFPDPVSALSGKKGEETLGASAGCRPTCTTLSQSFHRTTAGGWGGGL